MLPIARPQLDARTNFAEGRRDQCKTTNVTAPSASAHTVLGSVLNRLRCIIPSRARQKRPIDAKSSPASIRSMPSTTTSTSHAGTSLVSQDRTDPDVVRGHGARAFAVYWRRRALRPVGERSPERIPQADGAVYAAGSSGAARRARRNACGSGAHRDGKAGPRRDQRRVGGRHHAVHHSARANRGDRRARGDGSLRSKLRENGGSG